MNEQVHADIKKVIDENPIVLFMKGNKHFPRCGFSATVVEIMRRCEANFVDINVLESPEIRQGIKDFSNWQTIPQLYVGGEFIGGCDIARDMYESGELEPLVKAAMEKSAE